MTTPSTDAEELRAALQPFADYAARIPEHVTDGCSVTVTTWKPYEPGLYVLVGDLRKAHALLSRRSTSTGAADQGDRLRFFNIVENIEAWHNTNTGDFLEGWLHVGTLLGIVNKLLDATRPPDAAPSPGACQPPQWQEIAQVRELLAVALEMDGQFANDWTSPEDHLRAHRRLHEAAEAVRILMPKGSTPREALHRPAPPRGET